MSFLGKPIRKYISKALKGVLYRNIAYQQNMEKIKSRDKGLNFFSISPI